MTHRLDRLDDDALRARAAPFLAAPTPGHGLRVDVASGVATLDEVAGSLLRATFKTGRKALYRKATSMRDVEDHDADELATAVARAASLTAPEVLRASDSELYTALPADDSLLGIDLPDVPAAELRAILDRFAVPSREFTDAELAGWAQSALLDRSDAGRRLRTVDGLTGTAARHPGEWAIDGDQLIPLGFPSAWRSATVIPSDAERAFLDAIRPAIEALRPEFDRRRRGPWLDRTGAAFEALGAV